LAFLCPTLTCLFSFIRMDRKSIIRRDLFPPCKGAACQC
jgi:hypothetical protein